MFFIQGLLCVYNKHPQSNQLKIKHYSWHALEKQQLTFMEPQFIQIFIFLLIVRIYHC
jgi:hypothetical protein